MKVRHVEVSRQHEAANTQYADFPREGSEEWIPAEDTGRLKMQLASDISEGFVSLRPGKSR